ncbi:hypothetical protein Xsto_04065 [Xenorhabdus stockiae]|uniref:Uncharacterized protein n=1 Tax=Xenorhabdus stockiae TaxID=351614 RepID=A0A2D0K6Q4_9GAMM|nr:hypothetical protein [Xenorhabdus stockiae]PHM59119.1 hypothetical protein Xsto_04065 [Xenorhabdus stockiae]
MNIPKISIEISRKSAKEFCDFYDDDKLSDESLVLSITDTVQDALNDIEFPASEIKTTLTND